jgi:hypothetical protein
MGPYMALIVPNSFYGIDAGLHALSFSLYFVGGGLWRLLNINLFITAARPLKSIFSLY